MSVTKYLVVAALLVGSFVGGRKSVKTPHLLVFDRATKSFVALNAPDGAKVVVVSPEGIEPGAVGQITKDGKFILILPPSMMDDDTPPEPPGAPHAEPQSDKERLDHADLIRISR